LLIIYQGDQNHGFKKLRKPKLQFTLYYILINNINIFLLYDQVRLGHDSQGDNSQPIAQPNIIVSILGQIGSDPNTFKT